MNLIISLHHVQQVQEIPVSEGVSVSKVIKSPYCEG